MKIGIVGYGPAGIISAIALTNSGHDVTIFERDNYTLDNVGKSEELDKTKTYPIDVGAKGLRAIEYVGAMKMFEKYCNPFEGVSMDNKTIFLKGEEKPGFCGSRLELMWAL